MVGVTTIIFVAIAIIILYLAIRHLSKLSIENYIALECSRVPEVWYDVDRYIPARLVASRPQLIPRKIFQTNREQVLPGMKDALDSWVRLNPEYEYHYYPTDECRAYLVEHFSERVVRAYDVLIPGAYKADLWRYCILYREGGVYADSAMVLERPLSVIIHPDDRFIVPIDGGYEGGLYNAFICCTPQHPLLKKTIEIVLNRVEKREYGYRDLWPTGPVAMGDAFNDMRGRPRGSSFTKGIDHGIKLPLRLSERINSIGIVYDLDNAKIITTKYRCHVTEKRRWYTTRPYSDLWKERKIYVEDK